eukprot:SAG25_NODE_763_length_5504_cov_4.689362_9_plen_38_part_00
MVAVVMIRRYVVGVDDDANDQITMLMMRARCCSLETP